jgi:hypothetical protein
MALRLSKELPPTMATWFQVLAIGNQQIAIRLPQMNNFSISAIKSFFFPSPKVMTKADCCAGQLNQVFTDLLNNYEDRSSGLS